jgi:hypothetical protein
MKLAEGRPAPRWEVGNGFASPPGVELGEDSDEFFFGDPHPPDVTSRRRLVKTHLH